MTQPDLKAISQRPVRVLFLIDSFRMGGAERITVSLLPEFMKGTLIQPIVCTLNEKEDCGDFLAILKRTNIPVLSLNIKKMLSITAIPRLIHIIHEHDIQLLHVQLQDSNILGAVAGKLSGTPVITTRHLIDDSDSSLKLKMRNFLERAVTRLFINHLVGVSDAARNRYIQLTRFPEEKSSTIYNGIDITSFHARSQQSRIRSELGIEDTTPLIAFVSVLREGKGHLTALKAMKKVPDAHLLIIGDGDKQYKSKVLEMLSSDKIHLLGQRIDIPEILGGCDLFILPTEFEALPTVLLEAGAAGLPAIVSDVGGCGEIIRHGINGYLIPPGDDQTLANYCNELLLNRIKAKKMGNNAYNMVLETFSITGQLQRLTELYLSLIHR